LPIGVFLVRCSSSGSSTGAGGDAPAAPPSKNGTQDVYSSSNVQAHFHTFSLDDASITAPPAAGVSGDTSSDQDHTHSVSISADQLQQVSTGQSVTVTTSSSQSHTHVFTFVKVS